MRVCQLSHPGVSCWCQIFSGNRERRMTVTLWDMGRIQSHLALFVHLCRSKRQIKGRVNVGKYRKRIGSVHCRKWRTDVRLARCPFQKFNTKNRIVIDTQKLILETTEPRARELTRAICFRVACNDRLIKDTYFYFYIFRSRECIHQYINIF